MTGKRQHYIPRFMQRRFALDPRAKSARIYRLELSSGRAEKVNVTNNAVKSRYYRIVREDGSVDDSADEVLDRLESDAAPVIAKLAEGPLERDLSLVQKLALFILTLKQRTPEGREQLRENDRRVAELWLEAQLSDRQGYLERMVADGESIDEVDRERLRLLERLRSGEQLIESTPSREIALMFISLEETSKALLSQVGWTLLRAPAGSSFVLSDHPVAHFDPTPKFEGAGAGFLSSPTAITTVPLDPAFAVLLQPQEPAGWGEVEVESSDVDEINLLTYAWASEAIYGPSQEAVTRVRMLAKRKRAHLARFAKRPPRVWIAEVDEEKRHGGIHTFTSTYKDKTLARSLYVSDEALADVRAT